MSSFAYVNMINDVVKTISQAQHHIHKKHRLSNRSVYINILLGN